MQKISDFLFTGVMQQTVMNIAARNGSFADAANVAVMAVEILAAIACFLIIYRKNGYDSD